MALKPIRIAEVERALLVQATKNARGLLIARRIFARLGNAKVLFLRSCLKHAVKFDIFITLDHGRVL